MRGRREEGKKGRRAEGKKGRWGRKEEEKRGREEEGKIGGDVGKRRARVGDGVEEDERRRKSKFGSAT